MMQLDRRGFLTAALWVAASPVIVRAGSLMPVRALQAPPALLDYWDDAYPERFVYPRGDLRGIRGLLLPGLRTIFGTYPQCPAQWTEVYNHT